MALLDQVLKYVSEPRVRDHRRQRIVSDSRSGRSDGCGQGGYGLGEQRLAVDRAEPLVRVGCLRIAKKAVYKSPHPVRGLDHEFQALRSVSFEIPAKFHLQQLGMRRNGPERLAQIVGYAVGKPLQLMLD